MIVWVSYCDVILQDEQKSLLTIIREMTKGVTSVVKTETVWTPQIQVPDQLRHRLMQMLHHLKRGLRLRKNLGSQSEREWYNIADALNRCLCGSVLDGLMRGVLQCKQAGCETQCVRGGKYPGAKSINEWGPEVPNSQTIYIQITITT